ncbi:hypothetical protein Y032_0004g1780 [Ancylostoma ceylanicum]|uniref:Uncharacterized protein n=1 Tax=Ancylostoma ceylanicum TaxID=53326 RepID=A0A016VTQ7_9BILA|nr:hypothetical protein Y032_0004g1780 [Ancylostoma ceylanicum]
MIQTYKQCWGEIDRFSELRWDRRMPSEMKKCKEVSTGVSALKEYLDLDCIHVRHGRVAAYVLAASREIWRGNSSL